jgi:hypothetical protein
MYSAETWVRILSLKSCFEGFQLLYGNPSHDKHAGVVLLMVLSVLQKHSRDSITHRFTQSGGPDSVPNDAGATAAMPSSSATVAVCLGRPLPRATILRWAFGRAALREQCQEAFIFHVSRVPRVKLVVAAHPTSRAKLFTGFLHL